MICHPKKFIFIHIPKTGGTSILNFLKHQDFFVENSIKWNTHYDNIDLNISDSYFKFAFHRNPWDRMVSLWQYWTVISKKNKILKKIPNAASFEGFCKHLYYIYYMLNPYERVHFLNQVSLNGCNPNLKIDFWGRFSHLNEDFKKVCDILNINFIKLPHKNKSNHKNYKDYYNDYLIKLVEKLYKKDIEYFNYTFGN